MKILVLTFFICSAILSNCDDLNLNGVPFQFQLGGNVSYVPTSGGIQIPGYIVRIGYTKHQWIGIKFMTLTSTNNYDVLIVSRSTTSNGGFYTCSVGDYYLPGGQTNNLMTDTINNMDQQVTTLSNSNHYFIEFPRTKGDTHGEDWQGGDFVKICFFTSDSIFNNTAWSEEYESCYGFTVTNYQSTWVGYEINSNAQFNGAAAYIYGGIMGPKLTLYLAIYRKNPVLNGSQITLRIGNPISAQVGYDFQKCLANPGDYFGNSTTTLSSDLIYSGYNDNNCYVNSTSSSLTLYFKRLLDTTDDFDAEIGLGTSFCFLVGSTEDCFNLIPQATFIQMSVQSSIQIFQFNLTFCFAFMILIFFLF